MSFSIGDDVIDSRDVIARLQELRELHEAHETDGTEMDQDERAEFEALAKLESEAERYGDWMHGETLIHESYFVEYAKELVNDCYQLPTEFQSNTWPWRQMTIEWDAAAEDLKSDYTELEIGGETYYMRA